MNEIIVNTPFGTLKAYPHVDPEYPGIHIDIENRSVATVEFCSNRGLRTLAWNNNEEDYIAETIWADTKTLFYTGIVTVGGIIDCAFSHNDISVVRGFIISNYKESFDPDTDDARIFNNLNVEVESLFSEDKSGFVCKECGGTLQVVEGCLGDFTYDINANGKIDLDSKTYEGNVDCRVQCSSCGVSIDYYIDWEKGKITKEEEEA